MDSELERSVRVLEDALSTPGKKISTPGKKNLFKPRKSTFDMSATLQLYEMQNLMEKSRFSVYDESTILHDKTVAGSIIQHEAPWKSVSDSLYVEFFEILQSQSAEIDVFDVVSNLANCSQDALRKLQSLKSQVAVQDIEEERWLENECYTWRLLFILYQDRLMSKCLMEDDILQYFGKSEKLCVENLYKRDSLIRESQLVIDWLESIASEKDDEVLHFSDSTVGWENTLHQLQSAETIAFKSSRQIVTRMDPDAPHYQKKVLHDLDMEDEKRICRKIFQEIRCGKLEEAEKLCRQCGHSWRAAIFEGWRLFHNPNIKEPAEDTGSEIDDGYVEMDTTELGEIEGNSNRDIWKIMALKYCKQDYLGPYEKATVGSFCGCLNAVLPVCHSWEDYLWAYMKTMVDIRVESEIRDCCTRNNEYMPLPEDYWVQRMSLNDVFSHLESSKNQTIREHSRRPERIIQKYIILDETCKLLEELENWVDDPMISTQILRFAAHLVLFLDQIGRGHDRNSIEKIIEAYIKRLMNMNETQLVSFYVSKLSQDRQVYLYAQYLENIIDMEDRKAALRYAEDSALPILDITKRVVENIRKKPHDVEPSGNLQQKLTAMDKYKISALDWVLFYETQRIEAVRQSNALIFTFLTLGKLDAAQLAFNKIPPNAIQYISAEESNEDGVDHIIKEHLSYKAYLDAHEAFNEWFSHSKSKPTPPEDVPENAPFPEKVAHQHRVSQYKAELERWKLSTNHLAKTAKTMLYNVLLFPEGWLVDAHDGIYLRSICIPEVVMLLYSVLSESGMHEECVQLADIIASEKYSLYKVYSTEKLQELLIKLTESSVALLKEKKDPWGCEMLA